MYQAYRPMGRWQSVLLFWLFCMSIGAITGTLVGVAVR